MASQITSLTIVHSTVYSGRSKKTSKLCVTGLCEGNSPVTGQFTAQRASNVEDVSSWYWYVPCHRRPCQMVCKPDVVGAVKQRHEHVLFCHDDVIKWKHFPRYWLFVRGIHRSLVNSPHKGRCRGALIVFFDLRLIKRLSKRSWRW